MTALWVGPVAADISASSIGVELVMASTWRRRAGSGTVPKGIDSNLSDVGEGLSVRIARLEQRMSLLQRKCAHCVFDKSVDYGIGFKRHSGKWRLFGVQREYIMVHDSEHGDIEIPKDEWALLADVSLEQKSSAIQMLPVLLHELGKEYDRRIELVRKATEVLDRIESDLPDIPKGAQQ